MGLWTRLRSRRFVLHQPLLLHDRYLLVKSSERDVMLDRISSCKIALVLTRKNVVVPSHMYRSRHFAATSDSTVYAYRLVQYSGKVTTVGPTPVGLGDHCD